MAKLSTYRRINKNDFGVDYQELVDQLGTTINASFDELYSALNKRLTFSENFLSTVTDFSVTVDADGIPRQRTQVTYDTNIPSIQGVLVLRAASTNNKGVNGAVFVSYTPGTGILTINKVSGLIPNEPYVIKILII